MVAWVLRRLGVSRRSPSYDDLAQEGALEVLKCLPKYDPARGAFSTFAVFHVRRRIQTVITRGDGRARRGWQPTVALPDEETLAEPRGEAREPMDWGDAENRLLRLPTRQAELLRLYIGGWSLKQIALRMRCSSQRVSQLIQRAIRGLGSPGVDLRQFRGVRH